MAGTYRNDRLGFPTHKDVNTDAASLRKGDGRGRGLLHNPRHRHIRLGSHNRRLCHNRTAQPAGSYKRSSGMFLDHTALRILDANCRKDRRRIEPG